MKIEVTVLDSPFFMFSVDVKQHLKNIIFEDVPLVEFMYLVFTRMPGESYRIGDSGLSCFIYMTSFEH